MIPGNEAWHVSLFEHLKDWQPNSLGWQPVPDGTRVKVMYSNGFVSDYVRVAEAWRVWTGGRDWWQKPKDGRLWIMCYVVVN